MFCKGGKNGEGRRITYDDVTKDFSFMAAKGFDLGYIGRFSAKIQFSGKILGFYMYRAFFSYSIFIRAVIDHMICYNSNWSKINL